MPDRYRLRYFGDPILRAPATPLAYGEKVPYGLVDAMRRVLARNPGYGIAAQQVGATCRVALCDLTGNHPPKREDLIVAINLVITEASPETFVHTREGCLSVQSSRGQVFRTSVRRHRWVRVEYRDEQWQLHRRELKGLAAIVAQHEVDHLDGRCIADGLSRQQRRRAERLVNKGAP